VPAAAFLASPLPLLAPLVLRARRLLAGPDMVNGRLQDGPTLSSLT
jgi:hypothetical protein